MEGADSLEQTIRDENTSESLPVLTIGNISRFVESEYRKKCATRLIEIICDKYYASDISISICNRNDYMIYRKK